MTKSKIHALVIVLMLVPLLPARAFAADDAETVRAKKLAAAARLDSLKADDLQLEAAVRTLDAGIAVQSSETAAARQAANAAEVAADAAAVRLAATEKRVVDLKAKASAVAVNAYVHPAADTFLELMKAKDLAEASRRQTLMSQVVQIDRDVLGELRAVRQDQQSEQVRLRNALDVRIQEYTAEINALTREEANIANLIRARQVTGASVDGRPLAVAGSASRPSGGGAGMVWPAAGSVSSPYGWRWGAMHTGIDIDAGYGASIVAAKGGVVISAGWYGGYGQCTIIDHGGGLTTLYAHQSSMSVREGQSVSQGQLIGYVGGTGNVTGPHLHFETRVGGSPQNPMNYLP